MEFSNRDLEHIDDLFDSYEINYLKAVNTLKFWGNVETEFGQLVSTLLLSNYQLGSWFHESQRCDANPVDAVDVCSWVGKLKRHYESNNLLFFKVCDVPRLVFATKDQLTQVQNHTLYLRNDVLWAGVTIEPIETIEQFVQEMYEFHQRDLDKNLSTLSKVYGFHTALTQVQSRPFYSDTVVEQFIKRNFFHGISVQTSKDLQTLATTPDAGTE